MNENKQISVIDISKHGSEYVPERQKNTFWHGRAGSLYRSVKNTVLSFFEGDSLSQQVGSSQKAPTQGSSRIRKFVANTSFVVGGLVGGLAVTPVVYADTHESPVSATTVVPKASVPHVPTVLEQKIIAEKNQKIIDARLKQLLVLKNMKGVLAHEGIPSGVTDYEKYANQQHSSIRVIDKKIRELTQDASKGSEFGTPVSNSTLGQVVGNANLPPPLTAGLDVPLLGYVEVPLSSSSVSIAMANRPSPTPPSPIKDDTTNTPAVTTSPSSTPLESTEPPKKVSKEKRAETSKISKSKAVKTRAAKKIPVPPELGSTATSGLNQDTLTEKKLGEFLSRVNTILASADKKLGLKGAAFTYKTVTVKRRVKEGNDVKVNAVPALRIIFEQGKRRSYFTVPQKYNNCDYEYLSPNFKHISSESALIDLAKEKTGRWAKEKTRNLIKNKTEKGAKKKIENLAKKTKKGAEPKAKKRCDS